MNMPKVRKSQKQFFLASIPPKKQRKIVIISILAFTFYNVANKITCESDVKILRNPHSLHVLVKKFLDTYSGDYRTA